jgi:hypothetical protein
MSVLSAAATIASEVLTAGATAGIAEAGKVVDAGGNVVKTGITKASKAAEEASDMVGKLKLAKAMKNFPTNKIDKATVTKSVLAAVKPNKLTVGTKVSGAASDAATLIDTIVGISNNSNLSQDQQNWEIAQAVLQTSSLVDPTGIAGVVAAYTKPLCSVENETASNGLNLDLDRADEEKFRREVLGSK